MKGKLFGLAVVAMLSSLFALGDMTVVYENDFESYELGEVRKQIKKCHDYRFVGKAGLFCPMKDGIGAGRLVRENNGKYAYAAGAKGYRWLEAETVKELGLEDGIDLGYFEALLAEAVNTVENYGDFTAFVGR